ncbi:MAG: sugar phosphate nucleotidyltransferase, partial [Candidatus Anstonellaceae archaeon]
MKKSVIAAVLAGGLGTRLRPLTLKIPKPLVPVNRKPFISFVLENLASHKIRECVILTGYKHEMIQKFCKDGKRWGLQIRYSHEPYSLGTGGAVVFARKML